MAGLLDQTIQRITVKTAWGPDIVLDRPFEPGPPGFLMGALRPRIEIETSLTDPLVVQPYGDPGQTRWPLLALGALALSGLGLAYLLGRRLRG